MTKALLVRHVNCDIENVVPTNQNASVVGNYGVVNVFRSTVQQNVHVPIAADHSALVFDTVLQGYDHVGVESLGQHVQRLPTWFHRCIANGHQCYYSELLFL